MYFKNHFFSEMYGQMILPNSPLQHQPHHHHNANNHNSIRTVYLGNISSDLSVSDIIDHVKTGPIQAIRPLPEKNGMFITFLDASDAAQFYHEFQRNRLTIHGHELKIGWGKPSIMTASVQNALQNGASRNVYLGLLDDSISEQYLRDDLSRFGHIEHVKIIAEKHIAFIHFLCITNAVKCVNTLPTESKWQFKRVNYGKDRCSRYQHQHQQQQKLVLLSPTAPFQHQTTNSAYDLFTGLPIIYHHHHHIDHTDSSSNNSSIGLANRTVYLGNIHPDTTAEDICNVVRGGILSQIRFMPDKHIAFVTFVDTNVASMFISQSTQQCLVVKNRRLKVGWGKPSALPIHVYQAVQHGGSRNVYIGNIDESITEEKLKHDFSEYGDIELVNTLKEKNCAFVNFTSIAGAVRAIDGIRSKEEYKKFRINYGKDRCGNPPRVQQQQRPLKQYQQQEDLLVNENEEQLLNGNGQVTTTTTTAALVNVE
jgi:RNA recognition motif-containing protein